MVHQLNLSGTNEGQLVRKVLVHDISSHNIHYLTMTGNYALSSHDINDLFKEQSMFGWGIGYGMDSMFGPLEATLNYNNRANKVNLYINLGYKF